jgi:hypothetical protein
VGAIIGAIFLASRKSVLGLGKIIVIASGIFGIGLIFFSLSHILWLSFFLLLLAGFGMMVHMASYQKCKPRVEKAANYFID